MGDALAVRLVQRIPDLDRDLQRLTQRQRPLLQPLSQDFPVEILQDQEVDPVLAPDVKQRAGGSGSSGSSRHRYSPVPYGEM